MRRLIQAFLTLGCLLCAVSAQAGELSEASGPILVNGSEVVLVSGETLPLGVGDEVDAGSSTVTWTSEAGDAIRLQIGARARAEGADDQIDLLFLTAGVATGRVTSQTGLGAAAGWITAAEGADSAFVRVTIPADRQATDATYRSVGAGAWVRYADYKVWLPRAHEVALTIDPDLRDRLAFYAFGRGNDTVRVYRTLGTRTLDVRVPVGVRGDVRTADDETVRVRVALASDSSRRMRVALTGPGAAADAVICRGAMAVVDPREGLVSAAVPFVDMRVIRAVLRLSNEFAALARSAFADVR